MARLDALPSIDIIRGLKGVLDFYLWKGLPCVRSWPYTPPHRRTAGTEAAAALFGEVSTNFRLLAPLALEAFQEQAKDQPRTSRDLYISGVYGHLHAESEAPPPPPEEQMYDAYVHLQDRKPAGTNGGTFTSGADRTRDMTHILADPEGICTLAANQFTLPAGAYRFAASCPAFRVNSHRAYLKNIDTGGPLVFGTTEYCNTGVEAQTRSLINGRFVIAVPTTMAVVHRSSATRNGNGFGVASGFDTEIYTYAEIWREAP